MAKIIAKRRGDRQITYSNQKYKLDNGQEVTDEQAYDMAKAGQLEGVVGVMVNGSKSVKSVDDESIVNNIDSLPWF